MKEFTAETGGVVFRISADESLGFQAATVLEAVLERSGEARDGLVVQVGWGVFKLAAEPAGFRILAPTYSTEPTIEFAEDATLALWIHAGQAATLLTAGIDPAECRFDDRLIFERRAMGASKVFLERQSGVKPGDSGWFLGLFGATEPVGADGLVSVFTYQMARVRPSVMKVLGLPHGSIVLMTDNVIDRVIGPDRTTLITGPF